MRATINPRHAHHVELKSRRVQSLVLLVLRHQHFAALMPAFLRPRALILDVITRHAHFHEPPNQIANVRIAAVPGVSIRNNERPEIISRVALRCASVIRERKYC